MCKSVNCSSYIMTNTVVVKCKRFVPVSVKLNYCSALVLVPLKNTANLKYKKKYICCNCCTNQDPDPHIMRKNNCELTCPLCSPSTTIIESYSLFGTMVSSISCLISAKQKKCKVICK